MKFNQVYYRWMAPGDEEGEFYTPHANPYEHEFQYDFLYDSAEEALQGLDDMGYVEEARGTGWVLVTEVLTHVPVVFPEGETE
jgi:hypothetical protein